MPEVVPYIGRLIWNREPVGTGFLVHRDGLIATCYHVIARNGKVPVGEFLTFEFLASGERRRAQITGLFNKTYDVALLQMSGRIPDGVDPAVLIQSSAVKTDMRFKTQGYGRLEHSPHPFDFMSAAGDVTGTSRRSDGVDLLQLNSKQILRGMSGGPVIVDGVGGVVGLISARYSVALTETSFFWNEVWAARSEHLADLDERLTVLPPVYPPEKRGAVFWIGLATLLLIIFVGAGVFLPQLFSAPTPVPTLPPMSPGFNVAVAQFARLDEDGQLIVDETSTEISNWLFNVVSRESQYFLENEPGLSFEIRGPDLIGYVEGIDPKTRQQNAEALAVKHGATLLIYGIVYEDETGYQVSPEFYVNPLSSGFSYGSEVVGSDRLGTSIPFTPPLDPQDLKTINTKLFARGEVMSNLIRGLAYFYLNEYNFSVDFFEEALQVEGWEEDEGQEVVHMLIGSAYLRDYATSRRPDLLTRASEAFTETYRINEAYVRNYLGLGAVALQQAVAPDIESEDTLQCPGPRSTYKYLNEKKLSEALMWFEQGLEKKQTQPSPAFVDVKAAYSLGQVSLLLYECDHENRTPDEASKYFDQVISAYETENTWDLQWFAGHAYYYSGHIAGFSGNNWEKMSEEIRMGISILETLPNDPARSSIARYWIYVAFAEDQAGHPDPSHDAYCEAMQTDSQAVEDMKNSGLKDFIEFLAGGGSCVP